MSKKYKLVPVEPTEHMLDSGQCASFRDIETQDAVRIYEAMLAAAPDVQGEPVAWLPYLTDRADGVTGHYAIARKNPAGYREVWNLRSHRWAAFSDEVLTLDEALALLKKLEMPTAPQPNSEQVENWRHDAEDLEALHNNLDDAGTPRHHSSGAEYSAWGRVIRYAKAAAQAEAAEQQPAPDVTHLVEALEQCITSMLDSGYRANAVVIRAARAALAAYHKGGDA